MSNARHEFHYVARGAVVLFVIVALALYGVPGFSMSSAPPYPPATSPECEPPKPINALYSRVQCWFTGYPYAIDLAPIAYIVPNAGTLTLNIWRHGYSAVPVTCVNDDGSAAGQLVIKPCAVYYPDQRLYGTTPLRMAWGGAWNGTNYEGYLACAAIEYALTRWGMRVDIQQGITLRGTSEGGTYAILQSVMMPCIWQQLIRTVDATLPHTLFVKYPEGQYWRDPSVRKAWGDFDIDLADFEKQAASGRLNHIYYRVRGASNDSLGIVDTEFFRICDRYRIACVGTWDFGGHSHTGEPGVNLPRGTFNEGQAPIRRDSPLCVFNNSSANWWEARGYYGLGLSCKFDTLPNDRNIHVSLRYRAVKNIGGGIPDQPGQAKFNFTLRRISAEVGERFSYRIGTQTGVVVGEKKGELTISGIELASSEQYTVLEIWR